MCAEVMSLSFSIICCYDHMADIRQHQATVTGQLFVYIQSSITARLIYTARMGVRTAERREFMGGNDGKRLGGGRRSQKGTEVKLCELADGVLEQEGK